jgi:hypothetical protein
VAKAKVTDVTGRQREQLVKENQEELQRRAAEMSLATATEAQRNETEVTDLSSPSRPTVIDEIEDLGVTTADDSVVIRVAEQLDFVTIGAGNHYSFEVGKKYKVPASVANHLREKGYLYERA